MKMLQDDTSAMRVHTTRRVACHVQQGLACMHAYRVGHRLVASIIDGNMTMMQNYKKRQHHQQRSVASVVMGDGRVRSCRSSFVLGPKGPRDPDLPGQGQGPDLSPVFSPVAGLFELTKDKRHTGLGKLMKKSSGNHRSMSTSRDTIWAAGDGHVSRTV